MVCVGVSVAGVWRAQPYLELGLGAGLLRISMFTVCRVQHLGSAVYGKCAPRALWYASAPAPHGRWYCYTLDILLSGMDMCMFVCILARW